MSFKMAKKKKKTEKKKSFEDVQKEKCLLVPFYKKV